MALNDKKYSAVHDKTGDDKARLKSNYDEGHINTLADLSNNGTNPEFGALIYMIQEMQEELDYLRGLISTNKDKTTFPGIGTSRSTCLAGDTTTISTSQASAITANTAKTGISTSQASAITANTSKVSFPFTGGTSYAGGSVSTATFRHNTKANALVVTVTIPEGPLGAKREPAITKSVTLTLS